MTRFVTDDEQAALDHATKDALESEQSRREAITAAQSRIDREHAEVHARLRFVSRALFVVMLAVLALTAAAVLGWYHGGLTR